MEVYTGAENIVTEKSIGFGLLDRHMKSFDGQRIFCTHIDITILCTNCISGNGHTFDHLVWITFHYGAIHKCTRITFVTVADYIAYFFFLTCNL